jgi:hypothetical protein
MDTLAGMPRIEEAMSALRVLLVERGWVAREQRFVQLGFTRPVRDEFAATLELSVREVSDSQPADSLREFARGFAKELAGGVAKGAARKVTRGRWPARPPLRVFGYAGLECLPATRVLRALSGSAEERVRIGAWSLCPSKLRTRETFGWVELKPDDEWRAKLAVLVKNVDQRAGALAKAYATPAGFVDELRDRTEQNIEGLLAALIAYDHTGDARELINHYEENATLSRQRCFRQALRVLGAEVSLETLEQAVGEPLPARFEIDWSALRRVGSNSRNAKRHHKEILSAVRDSHAITREERRSLLKAELSSRGIYVPPAQARNSARRAGDRTRKVAGRDDQRNPRGRKGWAHWCALGSSRRRRTKPAVAHASRGCLLQAPPERRGSLRGA